jgi:hypothetical protein
MTRPGTQTGALPAPSRREKDTDAAGVTSQRRRRGGQP